MTDFFDVSRPAFTSWRGRGLILRLEIMPDMSVLTIQSKATGERHEVRGHSGVGTVFQGGPLDRVIAALPPRVNVSELFADQKCGVAREWSDAVIDALEWEEEIVRRMSSSVMA